MSLISEAMRANASFLKKKASRYSILGTIIAIVTIIIATILSGYFETGGIGLEAFVYAQKNNMVLRVLDGMPFVFAFWGQYVSSMISYEASAMVLDQTQELRDYTDALEKKSAYEATHDSLTGLPNRTLFMDRLQQS